MRVQARTSAAEMSEVARAVAEKLCRYKHKARVKCVIPRKGFSSASVEGGPLYDPEADEAFIATLKKNLDPAIEVLETDADINSPVFAHAIAAALKSALGACEFASHQILP